MINGFIKENSFLSNEFRFPIAIEGITYTNNETAFYAQFFNEIQRKMMCNLPPLSAKQLYNTKHHSQMSEEEQLKLMKHLCEIKFTDSELRQKLLDTQNEELINNSKSQGIFWGVVDGEGENHLGKILMEIRSNIQNKSDVITTEIEVASESDLTEDDIEQNINEEDTEEITNKNNTPRRKKNKNGNR